MTIEKKGLSFLRALVVVITAFLLGICPLSATFFLESTDGHTSSATISRIKVAQNEWVPTGEQRFVGTLMLLDAKDNVLTADGHFLSSQLTQRCSSSALTTLRLEKACQARAINRP